MNWNLRHSLLHRGIYFVLLLALSGQLLGCRFLTRRYASPAQDGAPLTMPNPLTIPVTEIDFTWNQIVDTVDDYFEIAREQQVREIGGVLMEGWIESKPRSGATCLEPLRKDSTPGYERWHSTLQSIRRQAHIRVIPVAEGFQVYVHVHKEVEDVSQPEFSTVGAVVRRHDGSLVAFEGLDDGTGPVTLGWILLGRDESLEQEILQQLHARLFEVASVQ